MCHEENQGSIKEIEHRMGVGFMKGGHWVTFEKKISHEGIKESVFQAEGMAHVWPEDHIA